MQVKTSVTLPSALLEEIDRADKNRSAFLERAAMAYLASGALDLDPGKQARDLRDAEILDRHADRLNREASDVLQYQTLAE